MNPPPPPPFNCVQFSPCWCSVAGRENNPNCKTGLSIQSDLFAFLLVVFIVVYMLWVFKIIKSFPVIFKINSNWESKKNYHESKKQILRKIHHHIIFYWIFGMDSVLHLRNKKCIMNIGDKCLIVESTTAILLILIYFIS